MWNNWNSHTLLVEMVKTFWKTVQQYLLKWKTFLMAQQPYTQV